MKPPLNPDRVGRVQRQVRRALIAGGGRPVPFGVLAHWCYPRVRELGWRRWSIYRALKRWGVNVGVGLWGLRGECTQDQHLTGQIEALKATGASTIYREKVSGARADRPQLAKLMAALKPESAEAARLWASYLVRWTLWNHVRGAASLLATAAFAMAFRLRA